MAKMIPTKINDRWDIILPEHRANRPEYHTPPYWEEARLNAMNLKIKEGDVVYYVGAEEGEMPALCQMWGAKVVLFEPNDRVWPNIKAIWDANDLDEPLATFCGFAANNTNGSITPEGWPLSVNGPIIGDHGFRELKTEGATLPCIKLDDVDFIPNVISLDVEGSEYEVLRGADRILNQHKPTVFLSLHPEFMFAQYIEYGYDLRQWIRSIGYKETLLSYEHEVHLMYEAIR